jgi:hypothetical protein
MGIDNIQILIDKGEFMSESTPDEPQKDESPSPPVETTVPDQDPAAEENEVAAEPDETVDEDDDVEEGDNE